MGRQTNSWLCAVLTLCCVGSCVVGAAADDRQLQVASSLTCSAATNPYFPSLSSGAMQAPTEVELNSTCAFNGFTCCSSSEIQAVLSDSLIQSLSASEDPNDALCLKEMTKFACGHCSPNYTGEQPCRTTCYRVRNACFTSQIEGVITMLNSLPEWCWVLPAADQSLGACLVIDSTVCVSPGTPLVVLAAILSILFVFDILGHK